MQERSLTLFTNCPPDTTSNGVFGAVRRIADRSRSLFFCLSVTLIHSSTPIFTNILVLAHVVWLSV